MFLSCALILRQDRRPLKGATADYLTFVSVSESCPTAGSAGEHKWYAQYTSCLLFHIGSILQLLDLDPPLGSMSLGLAAEWTVTVPLRRISQHGPHGLMWPYIHETPPEKDKDLSLPLNTTPIWSFFGPTSLKSLLKRTTFCFGSKLSKVGHVNKLWAPKQGEKHLWDRLSMIRRPHFLLQIHTW